MDGNWIYFQNITRKKSQESWSKAITFKPGFIIIIFFFEVLVN
jgi:hypothetical protein